MYLLDDFNYTDKTDQFSMCENTSKCIKKNISNQHMHFMGEKSDKDCGF